MRRFDWILAAVLVTVPAGVALAYNPNPKALTKSNIDYDRLPAAVKSALVREVFAKGESVVAIRQEAEDQDVMYRIEIASLEPSPAPEIAPSYSYRGMLIISQDGKIVSGALGGATDHGNQNRAGRKHHEPNGNVNTDQGRTYDTDEDKGVKTSPESLDKDHIRQ